MRDAGGGWHLGVAAFLGEIDRNTCLTRCGVAAQQLVAQKRRGVDRPIVIDNSAPPASFASVVLVALAASGTVLARIAPRSGTVASDP